MDESLYNDKKFIDKQRTLQSSELRPCVSSIVKVNLGAGVQVPAACGIHVNRVHTLMPSSLTH